MKGVENNISLEQIDRIVYIWARYEGIRDSTKTGKHYSKSDVDELIRRLSKFKENSDSFDEGVEVEVKLEDE